MRYAFIAENRLIFAVRAMCRMLLVHPSGFYAWLREPFCQRALEDQRQTVLLKQAWDDSGEVYGYRKLHDDLCDLGEDISPNRALRLARLAGIRAQIGYKKKPGTYGGSPAVVADNTLNREFDVDAPDQFCLSAIEDNRLPVAGHRHHLHPHPRGLPVSCRRDRSVFAARCWVVHARPHLYRSAVASAADGRLAAQTKDQSSGTFPLSGIATQYPAGQRTKAHNSPATSGRSSSNSTI